MKSLLDLLQGVALILVGLVTGSVFGIWFGYDITAYSSTTLLEVHQGAVRQLNELLPAMGLASLAVVIVLAWMARRDRRSLIAYAISIGGLVAAGLITKFGNQPINAAMLGWTPETLPGDWNELARSWWTLHGWRLAAAMVAFLGLIAAVLSGRDAVMPRG